MGRVTPPYRIGGRFDNSPPAEPIPALPYQVFGYDSWRGMARLMAIIGLVIGATNLLVAIIIGLYYTQYMPAGLGVFEIVAYGSSVVFNMLLGCMLIIVASLVFQLRRGSNEWIVRYSKAQLISSAILAIMTVGLTMQQMPSMQRSGLLPMAYTIAFRIDQIVFNAVFPIVSWYCFSRPEMRQMFSEDAVG